MDQTSYSTGEEKYHDQGGQDTNMVDVKHEHGDGEYDLPKKEIRLLKPWEKIGPDGRIMKKPRRTCKKNALFGKAVRPRSSTLCLNELRYKLKYVTEPVETFGNVSVSVEVNGQTFRGYGSTKDVAKQAAAEAALFSFVKAPISNAAPGEAPNVEDDTTPWEILASYAMYKLFSDWRDGKIGMSNSSGQQGFSVTQQQQGSGIKEENNTDEMFTNVSLHLNNATNSIKQTPKKVKVNTKDHRTRHPVMILHQLCPVIKYESTHSVDPINNTKRVVMSALINGQQFTGEATTIKGAKFILAKAALKCVYDIDNIFCPK